MSSDAGGSGDDFELVDQVKVDCVAPSSSARTEERAHVLVKKEVRMLKERPTTSLKGPVSSAAVKSEMEESDGDGDGDDAAGTSPLMQEMPKPSAGDSSSHRLSRLATLLIGLSLGLSTLVPMNLWSSNLVSHHAARHDAAARALQLEHLNRAQHAATLVSRLQGAVESVWLAGGGGTHPSASQSAKAHLSTFNQELRHMLARVACISGGGRSSRGGQTESPGSAAAECESLQLLQRTFLLRVVLPPNTTFHPYPLPPDNNDSSDDDGVSASKAGSNLELVKTGWLSLLAPPLAQPQGSPDPASEVILADGATAPSHVATSAPPALPSPPGQSTICWTGATGVFCHTVLADEDVDANAAVDEASSALTAVLRGPAASWSTFTSTSKLPCGSELEILAPGHHVARVTCSKLFGRGACCIEPSSNGATDTHKALKSSKVSGSTEHGDDGGSGSDDHAHADSAYDVGSGDHGTGAAHAMGGVAARVAKATVDVLSGTGAAMRDATQKAAAAATAGGSRAAQSARSAASSLARLSHSTSAVVCNSTIALSNRMRASGAAVSDKLRGSSVAVEDGLRHSGEAVGDKVSAVGESLRHRGTTVADKLSAASSAFGNTLRNAGSMIEGKFSVLSSAVGSGLQGVRRACNASAAAVKRHFQGVRATSEQKAISPGIAVGDVLSNVDLPVDGGESSVREMARDAAAGARSYAHDYAKTVSAPFTAAKSRVAEWQAAQQGKRDAADVEATRKEWEAVKRTIHEAEDAVRAANHAEQEAVADKPASSLPLAQRARLAAIVASDKMGAWGAAVRQAFQAPRSWQPFGAKRRTWPDDL